MKSMSILSVTIQTGFCAFQVYGSVEAANAFLKSQSYRDYEQEVARLLEGPPTVEVLQPQWIKNGHPS